MKRILCTVTNDLNYDQRMIRICSSLQKAGYEVCLIGRAKKQSPELVQRPFEQKRLNCWFEKGKFFYIEYNIRLLFFLLFSRFDLLCSIDLDSLAAGYLATLLRRKHLVYDAHEYYTEVPELVERPGTQKIWKALARMVIPRVKHCYTVCESLAGIFEREYGPRFEVIRNVPFAKASEPAATRNTPLKLLYQGALNDGRGLEEMIRAMQKIDYAHFQLAGEGDLSQELRQLAKELKVEDRVEFLGYLQPEKLQEVTAQADIGINLLQNKGLNYYYSLANKFFDYMQAVKPSLNMAFPEYQKLCAHYETGILLEDLEEGTIHAALEQIRQPQRYAQLQEQCRLARKIFIWEEEEKKLLQFYAQILA